MANRIHNTNMALDEILSDEKPAGGYIPPEISKFEEQQAFDTLITENRRHKA